MSLGKSPTENYYFSWIGIIIFCLKAVQNQYCAVFKFSPITVRVGCSADFTSFFKLKLSMTSNFHLSWNCYNEKDVHS